MKWYKVAVKSMVYLLRMTKSEERELILFVLFDILKRVKFADTKKSFFPSFKPIQESTETRPPRYPRRTIKSEKTHPFFPFCLEYPKLQKFEN